MQGKTSQGRQGKATQRNTRQRNARQDKARQGKTGLAKARNGVVEAGARKQGGSDTQRRRGREAKKQTAKEEAC